MRLDTKTSVVVAATVAVTAADADVVYDGRKLDKVEGGGATMVERLAWPT